MVWQTVAQVVDRVTAAHEKLDFGETGRAFYDFFWSQFADWYIESAKARLYSTDAHAAQRAREVRKPLLLQTCVLALACRAVLPLLAQCKKNDMTLLPRLRSTCFGTITLCQ
jgi:valyl-tRNA synthetase